MIGLERHGRKALRLACCVVFSLASAGVAVTKQKPSPAKDKLDEYVQRARASGQVAPTNGGLWSPGGRFSDLATDYKARNTNDLIVIRIVEQTSAVANGAVKSQRTLDANSSISALGGQLGPKTALQNIFTPHSQQALNGQAQTTSNSQLTTSLAGHVVEALHNGALVVEAVREVEMNNQRQTLVVRGIARLIYIESIHIFYPRGHCS